jgi:hypothetical protein
MVSRKSPFLCKNGNNISTPRPGIDMGKNLSLPDIPKAGSHLTVR